MALQRIKVRGRDFVGTVQKLGGSERDAKRLWARLVSRIKGSRHGFQAAYAETVDVDCLREILAGRSTQFQHLKKGDWELITGAISVLSPAV